MVTELELAGCVTKRQLLAQEAPWVQATNRGGRLSTGEPASRRRVGVSRLRHTRAINDVRLHLAQRAPEGGWVCERDLRRQYQRGANLPDAVFEIGGERHALEVQISPSERPRVELVIAEHSARYDAVVYFCNRAVEKQFRRWALGERHPKLLVRRLPGPLYDPSGCLVAEKDLRPEAQPTPIPPSPAGIAVLDLLSEQRAVRVDHLFGLLDGKIAEIGPLIDELFEGGMIRRQVILAGEPEWLWPTFRGSRFFTTGLKAPPLKTGALPMLRIMNEVRIEIESAYPDSRWLSRRILQRGQGRSSRAPKAAVVSETEHCAIEVELRSKPKHELARKFDYLNFHFDSVICFCSPIARDLLERMKAREGWSTLSVRDLPEAASNPELQDVRGRAGVDCETELRPVPSARGPALFDSLRR
jgi:hypothetical protein